MSADFTERAGCDKRLSVCTKQSCRLKRIAPVHRVIFAATMCATVGSAHAQQSGSVREGRRLAHAACVQCHGVDEKGFSINPAAPAFADIANVPGMTSAALTVALRTSHHSMPNFVIKGRDFENIIAYVLSLKKTH